MSGVIVAAAEAACGVLCACCLDSTKGELSLKREPALSGERQTGKRN